MKKIISTLLFIVLIFTKTADAYVLPIAEIETKEIDFTAKHILLCAINLGILTPNETDVLQKFACDINSIQDEITSHIVFDSVNKDLVLEKTLKIAAAHLKNET